ncbi:CRISPR-associated endoribonuclease Cas13a-like [Belonocnema kinseyi]|uniref:CRISPR-associated endoribonuclease Cas13a-like n=1 Tax=Belonocnema kinseyi TaxID=2817044 RepID=UPI00143D1BDD|nr:CRISPR-associated endoribonuclease Cas13a-like [Belonocnema kinseyi]
MDYSLQAFNQMKDENEKLETSFMEYKALITACLKEKYKLLSNYLKQNAEIVQKRLENISDLIQKYKDGAKLLKEKNNKLQAELDRLKTKSLQKNSQNQRSPTLHNNIVDPNEASHAGTLGEIKFPNLVITENEKPSDKQEYESDFVTTSEGTIQMQKSATQIDDLIFKIRQMKTEKEKIRKDFLDYKKLMDLYLEKSGLLLLKTICHNTEMLLNLNLINLSTENAREIAICMINVGKYLMQNINLKQEIARQKASALEYDNPLFEGSQSEHYFSCIVSDIIDIQDVDTQTDMLEGIETTNTKELSLETENMLNLEKDLSEEKANAVQYEIVQGNQSEDYLSRLLRNFITTQDAVSPMVIEKNLDAEELEKPQDISEQIVLKSAEKIRKKNKISDASPCDICNQMFKTKSEKKRHMTREHHSKIKRNGSKLFDDKVTYTCEKCNTKFKYKRLLNDHIKKMHSGNNKFNCKFCTAQTTTGYNYRRHLLRFHSHEKDPEVQDLIKSFFLSEKNKIFPVAINSIPGLQGNFNTPFAILAYSPFVILAYRKKV